MKNWALTFFGLVIVFSLQAQKFGYVDTNYILEKMPEYKQAQEEIEKLSAEWEAEIRGMNEEIDLMYAELKAEEVLLTPEMKEERLKEIREREMQMKEYQREVFGYEGLLFLKKQELLKPIQDKVFEAVEKVARENRLSVLFDKAADLVMIYTDPRYDYTDFVLNELGLGDRSDILK